MDTVYAQVPGRLGICLGSVPTDWDDSRKEYRCTRQVWCGSQSRWLTSLNMAEHVCASLSPSAADRVEGPPMEPGYIPVRANQ